MTTDRMPHSEGQADTAFCNLNVHRNDGSTLTTREGIIAPFQRGMADRNA
jgi:hypothetical protein